MKSWFISSGLVLLSFSERSLQLLTFMLSGKNPYGNLLLNLCRGNDLFIVNGRIGDNKVGNLTCRNASVVDYTICNSQFLKKAL
jgi:hypothetical protein